MEEKEEYTMKCRLAIELDIPQILHIYNQGIQDRIAT
jgi:L-amino acid N-acyltransferase YncA